MAKETTVLERQGWKVIKSLGEGGQAKVYLAQREGSSPCAVKVLRSGQATQAYRRFHQEIEALKKVDHPGVIRIVEHGSDDDEQLHFYAMDYMEGVKPLKKIIGTEENFFFGDSLKSLSLYLKILEALDACEKAKIVHRDLSLGNVLLTHDGEGIKLIDFGCCHVDQGSLLTLTDENVGTPNYRSPECEAFTSQQPTIRADLYSAGKILWSLITNKQAFPREKPVFNDLSLNNVFPESPATWHLHLIFAKTIRHKPDDRYPSALAAIVHAKKIKACIVGQIPPLEVLASPTCPICRVGTLVTPSYFASHTLVDGEKFMTGQPDVEVIRHINDMEEKHCEGHFVCAYCGFSGYFITPIARRVLNSRKTLE